MDESGMPLDHKQLKRIAQKGSNTVKHQGIPQVSIVVCASAAGPVLPLMVIFKSERLNREYTQGEVPGTLYGMSPNGWIDQELFLSDHMLFIWL